MAGTVMERSRFKAAGGTRWSAVPYYSLAVPIGLACLYALFFRQIDSGFTQLFGDEYDGVIESVLISHWFGMLRGAQQWNDVLYFFPTPGTLGYNDGYLVYGLIASVFRAFGAGVLQAQELTHLTVKAIGFAGLLLLLDTLRGRSFLNLLGAALFTLAISSSNQAAHGQLLCMSFAPALTLSAIFFVRGVASSDRRATLIQGLLFVSLFNGLLMTSFYSTWFYALFAMIFLIVAVVRRADRWRATIALVHRVALPLVGITAWFILTLIPFLLVYLPKLKQTGGQPYSLQASFGVHPLDIFNIGPGSLLWGGAFSLLTHTNPEEWRPSEFVVGVTPDLLACLCGIAVVLATGRAERPAWIHWLGAALLIAACLPVTLHGWSLWYFVHFIPGSSGVRTIARFYIFLAFPAALLVTLILGELRNVGRALATAILAVLCLSQINLRPPVYLDAPHVMADVENAAAPPVACRSFFILNLPEPVRNATDALYRQNVLAMQIADRFDLPTLNGYSSFVPPDWVSLEDDGYPTRIMAYVSGHKLSAVCSYDATLNAWQQVT